MFTVSFEGLCPMQRGVRLLFLSDPSAPSASLRYLFSF
jgi:hypothetical protein